MTIEELSMLHATDILCSGHQWAEICEDGTVHG